MVCTFQMNIPEFQKNSPLSTKTSANSWFGFSVNVLTVLISPLLSSPICIYPYPVSGRLGFTPNVRRAGNFSTNSNPLSIHSAKASSLRIRWSDGVTTILASGSIDCMRYAAQAIQGAVFLRWGSNKMCLSSASGICCFTKPSYCSFVTMKIFSGGMILRKRS